MGYAECAIWEGSFPQRIELGPRSCKWFEDEVMIWLKSRQHGPFAVPARPANEILENATPVLPQRM
ncbi:MAG: AlpA family phage regulatory protein [Gammaproteobacteria bacterium]